MGFEITPAALQAPLRRLFPNVVKKRLLKQAPDETIIAGDGTLSLQGQLDNATVVAAIVSTPGLCTVNLEIFYKAVGGYRSKATLQFPREPDSLKFGSTRLKVHPT